MMADQMTGIDERAEIFTVSRLNLEVRTLLEGTFPLIWIEGEISNLAKPSSGHLYFSLKDKFAQIRCAMFKHRNRLLRFIPQDGAQVLARARVSLYEGRGEYQLVVEQLESAGEGRLRREFELLKQKLATEGLFGADRKQPLPSPPQCLGVITSPSGAAVRDVLAVLERRYPTLPVVIYPVPVQGDDAAPAIIAAIRSANRRKDCDLLLLCRGGGSLEDLWPFNDEGVVRAVAASALPTVSAIGHEVDFTITDFVADLRAPTPSAAAELIAPDIATLLERCRQHLVRLQRHAQAQLNAQIQRLDHLEQRLMRCHPLHTIIDQRQQLARLKRQLSSQLRYRFKLANQGLAAIHGRLVRSSPQSVVTHIEEQVNSYTKRLRLAMHHNLQHQQEQLQNLAHALNTISPLATLERGYAIVTNEVGESITSVAKLTTGSTIEARVRDGRIGGRIEWIKKLK